METPLGQRLVSAVLLVCLFWSVAAVRPNVPRAVLQGDQISHDVTWTLENSPYTLVNDVIVDAGVKLTIEPGVNVLFDGNWSLIVGGSLNATGTSDQPIVFTSNERPPKPGDWGTLKFVGGDAEFFQINFGIIEHATNGITIESLGKTVVEKCQIKNNLYDGIHIKGKSDVSIKQNMIELNSDGIHGSGDTVSGVQILDNSIRHNSRHAIYLHTSGNQSCWVYNVTISGNTVFSNKHGIYIYSGEAVVDNWYGYICFVDITGNFVSFNGDGIHLETYGWGSGDPGASIAGGIINNVAISDNLVLLNQKGIYINSYSAWASSLSETTISDNIVSSNVEEGIYLMAVRHTWPLLFDVSVLNNTVGGNEKGIFVDGPVPWLLDGGLSVNINNNSISYNSYGVFYNTRESLALNNDVYYNSLYGMCVNVTNNGAVNAENNYWGDESGPLHATLNPAGKGNAVNGNGEDLDFHPFLNSSVGRINEGRPTAVLDVNQTSIAVNQTVTFNAAASNDDLQIERYLFDFGDGENSGWTDSSEISHEYSLVGQYNASVFVVDDSGLANNNTATQVITVMPSLNVSIALDSTSTRSEEQVSVTVHVTNGTDAVNEALVELSSDEGGIFTPSYGYTNLVGDLNTTFTAPSVSEQTSVKITAVASKSGYLNGLGNATVGVLLGEDEKSVDLGWVWSVATVVTIIMAAVAGLMFVRSRKRGKS